MNFEKLNFEASEVEPVMSPEQIPERSLEEVQTIVEKALETTQYKGANLERLSIEDVTKLLSAQLEGVSAKDAVKAIEEARFAAADRSPTNPLSPEVKRILELEENFLRTAVEQAKTVEELMEIADSSVIFNRQPLKIGENRYSYAEAIQRADKGGIQLENLPNMFGVQEKLQSFKAARDKRQAKENPVN